MDKNKQHFRIDRQHLRVAIDMACQIGRESGGEYLPVRMLNLSIGGLKFSCGLQVINSILPEDQRTPGQILDVEMDIAFEIPQENAPALPIRTQARIVHSERLAQDEFHVGVQFIELDKSLSGALENYIIELMDQKAV
ncbi:MAG TPA: PilZ domain-containing protein [Gammaproteobacteria bacterium]|nr:PilZ domain-containing protein [Gammaproteobacteria bacterium]